VNLPLVPDLEHQDNMLFYSRLVWLLGEIGDKRAVEALLSYTNHQNQLIREWTNKALLKLGYNANNIVKE
jgi:HEAT repeat protein